jgi:hypothetical protein
MALILNVPYLVTLFFKMISPFIDPHTRTKMKFNPKAVEDGHFTVENVFDTFGGNINFAYEHEKYWPALVTMCEERAERWMAKWRELGGHIGIKEKDYKGTI